MPPNLVVGDFDSLGRRPNHPNVVQPRLPRMTPIWSTPCGRVWTGDTAGSSCWAAWAAGWSIPLANLQALAWLTTQGPGRSGGEGTVATALRNETMTFPPG